MSKQAEAKEAQGYRTTPDTCSNCAHYRSKQVAKSRGQWSWTEEQNKRCRIGGFAVNKTATCKLHVFVSRP